MMRNKQLWLLIILAALLYFFKLGSFSLYDAAETTYGEFIRGILRTGNWLTLHYNGQIIFDKPPLYYWLAAGLSLLFGLNEWTIRFWAALAGVMTVVTTYLWGKELHNQRTGWFAGLIAMTAFQFLIQSRIAELDIVLTLFLTLGLLLWSKWYQTGNKIFVISAYVPLALGMLIKGLLAVALPGCAVLLFLLFKKELVKIKEMAPLWGVLIIALIGLPWYVLEYLIHGKVFLDFALGFLFLSRFQGVVSGHTGPWFYYFLALILGFAPWSHLLPLALWRAWQQRTGNLQLLTLCFIVPAFIVFSIAQTKIPNYILPLYPPLAILVAKLWDDLLNAQESRRNFLIGNICLLFVVALLVIGVTIAGTGNYSRQYQELVPNLLLLAGILTVGSLCSFIFFLFQQDRLSFYSLPVMVVAITLALTTQTLPAVENYKGLKDLGHKVAEKLKPKDQIASYDLGNRPGVVYYNVRPVTFLTTEAETEAFLSRHKGYCFTTVDNYNKMGKPNNVFARKADLVVLK